MIEFQTFPASGGFSFVIPYREMPKSQKFPASGGFPLYFPIGNRPDLKRFPPPAVFLCIPLKEMSTSRKIPASGGFPLYFPLRRICFLITLYRGNVTIQNPPPPARVPSCFPYRKSLRDQGFIGNPSGIINVVQILKESSTYRKSLKNREHLACKNITSEVMFLLIN